jgi:murein DD-endopeptidase MepM/ murein hydrolase activator NlpD
MKKNFLLAISFLSITCVALLWGILVKRQGNDGPYTSVSVVAKTSVSIVKVPVIKYGLNLSNFVVIDQTVEKNEVFSDIFLKHNVAYQTISYLIRESKDIFNCKKIRAGNKYAVIGTNSDTGFVASKIVYEESKLNYVIFNLDDSLYTYRGQNKVERRHQEVAGVINGSLYETFDSLNIPSNLAVRIADIFSCTIDFYKLQRGDKFKIIYDQDFVKSEPLDVADVSAVLFTSGGKDYYAFYYEKEKSHEGEYFDENGNSMRKQFLKAPLKFFRITSKYSLNRFHPVVKEWRAHLGTDYAAAPGTPILATGEGVVEEAQFGIYNGNYVKIRHSGQYKTQYLHMSKIANGMHGGKHVKQGEVIGYVGSTGLATGPHVCYRFWKDGQQVDPFKQKMQFSEPLPKKYRSAYMAKATPLKNIIDKVEYGTKPSIPVQDTKPRLNPALQLSASR